MRDVHHRHARSPTSRRPKGVVSARIDAYTGGRPGSWTRSTRREWFIDGTQPGAKKAVDKPGLMYVTSCGSWRIDLTRAEPVKDWRDDVLGWMARARRGAGRVGRYGTATAYLPGRGSWGGQMAGACAPPPPVVCPPQPSPGQDGPACTPVPTPAPDGGTKPKPTPAP